MSQDTDFGRDVMDGARDQLKAMNLHLVAETMHKPTDTDFSASVAKLHDAGCDLVLLGTIVRDTVQIVSAIRKSGWNVDVLGNVAIYDQAVADVPGGITEGVYTTTSVIFAEPNDPRPAVREFAEKYAKLFGHAPNFAAEVGYSAAQLVVMALQKAGRDLTADSFIAAMESIKGYNDIFGSPTMSFSTTKHQGSNEAFLAQVKNGHWVQVGTESYGY
jgi:branched-chain amino acid transport system substrate-binding protein